MKLNKFHVIFVFIIIPILLLQGLWIFNDAKKRGEREYWLWGLFGILNTPGNLIVYLIVTRAIIDKYAKK
ncbi:hypothetical protein [uncultured Clostridium sp.]|uniref:hypothetical protein n=1 Tax=uncultured Clostridium sp. TaxID=59620 RepID=UPI0028F0B452|nr:hypothetical protein [uncultured Clostridium sp.]